MQEQVDQLQRQVEELERVIQSLRAEATIPYDIREALKASLGSAITALTPTGTTYAKGVNEAGSDIYSVSRLMDGTVPMIIEGAIKYIPYYN